MSSDALRLLASTALLAIFHSAGFATPITSAELLLKVIAYKPPTGLFPPATPVPRFRLLDQAKFDAILEEFSKDWQHGFISLSKERSETVVMDVRLSGDRLPLERKRKRVVDEDADSAAGDDPDDQGDDGVQQTSTLDTLNKELKEVYYILQKSTTKGRLLAEQVRRIHRSRRQTDPVDSFDLQKRASSPYVHISPRRTAPNPAILAVHSPPARIVSAT